MNRRDFTKKVLYGMAIVHAFPTKASEPCQEAFTIDPVPAEPSPTGFAYTGHTSAARCMLDLLMTTCEPEQIDYESFENLERQLEGTIAQELIDDGFIIGEGHLTFD